LSTYTQVGVQTAVEPDVGAGALEERVNAVLPLKSKEDDDDDDDDGDDEYLEKIAVI
jgi:hypothetical protein